MALRQIIFRGKRLDNGQWVYGYFRHYENNELTIEMWTIFDPTTCLEHEVDPATVGQYTGATDKNGNKIFEGDIFCPISNRPYYIFWDEERACFAFKNNRDYYLKFYPNSPGEAIIGNIHDNPELMKGGEK